MNEISITELYDLSKTIARSLFENGIYPWEVLKDIGNYVLEAGEKLGDEYEKIGDNIWAGKGTIIEKTALLNGPAIIGKNCEIRHAAYIRKNVIIGDGSVVGNSTEVKNSIIFNNVQVPHFNYVGDSILGYKSHLGAGVILSNVKSDRQNVKIRINKNKYIKTGMRKLGSMIGDYAEIGCNSVLNPGTVIGRRSIVYPLTMVRGLIPKNSILKNNGKLIEYV